MPIHRRKQYSLKRCARAITLLVGGGASLFMPAHAQDFQRATLEEIIVTAQKRAENILDVPAAVSALSAESLERAGVTDFSGLTALAPSLTISPGNDNNSSSIFLRGIGTFAFSIGVEPSVSVIVDDVPVVQQAQAFNNLSDIERIEVLRGPQGTLFGKNASAGVINIVTKEGTDEFSGSAELTITDDDEIKLSASLSGPMGDNSNYRLNAYTLDRDGHVNNLTTGQDVNNDEGFGVRGKFSGEFSDKLGGSLVLDYSERDSRGRSTTYLNLPADAALFGFFPNFLFTDGITAGEDNFNIREDDVAEINNEQFTGSVKLSYDWNDFTIESITSYQDWNYSFNQDVDGTEFNLAGVFTMGALSGGIAQGGPFEADQLTQEIRLISPAIDNMNYVLGLWFSDASTERGFERGPLFPSNFGAESSTSNIAVFGQISMDLSDRWGITIGARLGREEIEVDFNDVASGSVFRGDDSETFFTGKVAFEYEVSDELSSFFSVSSGYKGQGYDISTGFDQSRAENPIDSETSVSYEVGLKGDIMEGRGRFSVVVFLTDYDDYQAQSAVIENAASGLINLQLNNVGELRTKGIEADFTALLTGQLQLDASVALIDATIETFPGAECFPGQTPEQGCAPIAPGGPSFQNLTGQDLANSPDTKFNIGLTYQSALESIGYNLIANANYQYQDDINFSLNANPRTVQDSYGIANASIGLHSKNGKYSLTLFANNLFEEDFASGITDLSSLYNGSPVLLQFKPRNSQRYVGLRAKVGF